MTDNDNLSRLSRLTAILLQLQSRRIVSATVLAARFEVSVRTIYRDIRALEEAGVPILTEEGKGYSLMEGYRVAPVAFTRREANALITAEQLVQKNTDASFIRDYTDAVAKIKAVLRQSTKDSADLLAGRIALAYDAPADRTSGHLSALQLALTDFNAVEIDYQKAADPEAVRRVVEPFALLGGVDSWIMGAYCRLRNDFRLFRLDRIKRLHILPETFEPHKMTMAAYLSHLQARNTP